jgi:hypothetical protein
MMHRKRWEKEIKAKRRGKRPVARNKKKKNPVDSKTVQTAATESS